ncbi:MAG TPA: DUF4185 domain-containing protein, partial [Candidatus Eisenbacteria bacterium]|nr:DUF4185 domain-containing protein [Candidatus Eisenbacteria bacterium]
ARRLRPLVACAACALGAAPAHAAPARAPGPAPPAAAAAAPDTFSLLTWIPGSSLKVEQLIGDHDWQDSLRTVRSRTVTRADVLGNGLGYSFVSGDSLLFLFGDTIGATNTYVPRWAPTLNPYRWLAADPIAVSRTTNPDSLVLLDFYKTPGDTTLTVTPVYPDGTPLPMGGDDIPCSGVDLDGKLAIVASVGTAVVDSTGGDYSQDSSVVVRFDPAAQTFTAGRTLSRNADGGHFVMTDEHLLPMQFASSPSDSELLVFGLGVYRHSDIYLSRIRRKDFFSGLNPVGQPATRYFAGLVNGQPVWSDSESASVPIVQDNPLLALGLGEVQQPWPNDDPTIGNFSVAWFPSLNLWLMTFDGGRQTGPPPSVRKQTAGVYFTYAKAPWGPWIAPRLVYNADRDGGAGTIIHEYDRKSGTGSGPAGPTIGSQAFNNPDTTNGGVFAPQLIEPFVCIRGDTLRVDYVISTWNPYTVVRMRSKFLITPGQTLAAPPPPVADFALAVRPDPFLGEADVSLVAPHAGPVELEVFDLAGRRVRALHRGPLAAGEHEFTWDGRSDAGAAVRPGVYLVRLRAAGGAWSRRVVRLR